MPNSFAREGLPEGSLYSNLETVEALTEREYLESLTCKLDLAVGGDRVGFLSMALNPGEPLVDNLMESAIGAAKRDVEVTIGIDAYAFMFDSHDRPTGPLVRTGSCTSNDPHFSNKHDLLSSLDDAGVATRILNLPRSRFNLPHAGRSHLKAAAILAGKSSSPTEPWYAVGGANLEHTEDCDMMVGENDPTMALVIHGIIQGLVREGTVQGTLGGKDLDIAAGKKRLLLDVGRPGKSIILENMVEIIDNSNEWILTSSPYGPSGPLAKAMGRAIKDRNVKIFALHNAEGNGRLGSGVMGLLQKIERWHLPDEIYASRLNRGSDFLHAKLVANEQEALASSHNGVLAGTVIGTAEIGMRYSDPKISRDIGKKLLHRLGMQDLAQFDFLNELA